MCGIFGKLYFNKKKNETRLLIECLNTLSHRGPDDSGVYEDGNIFLGSRRLSVIDLSPAGHMPMCNEDKSLWIVFNGEIYNHLELRKKLEKKHRFRSRTDSEVVLHLFEEKGPGCLQELMGMFSFAIWNAKKKELFVARDRLGKKPVKYYCDDDCFIFSSELKAILKDKNIPRSIDYDAVDEYLTYQYVPSPKTGFKNIFKLEPAHYLLIHMSEKIEKKRYWQLNMSDKLSLKEEEWEEQIHTKLKESVCMRLMSDVPLGAHLSGGIDSSLVVAFMAQAMSKPVKTFSIGFEENDYNELPYARLVAQKYKTDHHELMVKPNMIDVLPKLVYHYEEPYADPSALPTWYLCDMTKKYVTVALNGDGGDENFAGYPRYSVFKLYQQLKYLPFKTFWKKISGILYQLTKRGILRKSYKFFSSYDAHYMLFYLKLIDYFDQEEKRLLYSDVFRKKIDNSRWRSFLESKFSETKDLDWLDKLLYTDINSYLPDDLLVKTDIAGMAHSLEVRSPFLDHEFMELTAQMPSTLKMKGWEKKYLLKKMAQKYLPQENIQRSKKGFGAPFEHWFRDQLNDVVQEKLLDKDFLSLGLFKKTSIERLIKSHQAGQVNYSNHLWALLMLREWLIMFNFI